MYYRSIITFLCLLIFAQSFSQTGLSTKSKKAIELYTEADNFRVRGQLNQAIALLQQALEKDDEFVEAYYRLGIVYMTSRNYQQAIKNFEKGLSLTSDIKKQKVFWFDLGETYFTIGEYDKSEKLISDFLNAETMNKQRIDRAKMLHNNIKFAQENRSIAALYKQKVLSDTVNRFVMQYFPVLTADQQELIFTRREGFRDEFDEDLVVSRKDVKGSWTTPQPIAKSINTSFNEGTCTISADGRKLIFTSCLGRESFGSCDLFESHKIGNTWTTPKNLGIGVNSSEWESQPSLSADGRTLYFVSDRRGGIGRRDIWVSILGSDGVWKKAKNVGKPVNTVYDEISPFIHVNNRVLYFASKGLTGYGGYDIYYSDKDTSLTWTEPKNFGGPVNDHEDQFSLFITADGVKAYYSHEELVEGGNSTSKIIEMEIPKEKRIKFKSNYVKGIVTDKETRKPLRSNVELIELLKNETESLVESDSISGQYLIVLTQGAEYALYVSKPGYVFKSLNFNYSEIKDFEPITLNIELERIKEGTSAVLQNVFFEVDKYDLKEKSIVELQKVLKFLHDNPNIKVEISGHTDNTGSSIHNQELSEKRAKAVYQYLISNAISETRISAKGYGATRPVAENNSESGKQQNRRIELELLK